MRVRVKGRVRVRVRVRAGRRARVLDHVGERVARQLEHARRLVRVRVSVRVRVTVRVRVRVRVRVGVRVRVRVWVRVRVRVYVRVGVRRLAGVEEADNVDAQVALQPLQRGVGAVHDLGDARVGEDLVERVVHGLAHRAVQRDRVDQEVLVTRADLH